MYNEFYTILSTSVPKTLPTVNYNCVNQSKPVKLSLTVFESDTKVTVSFQTRIVSFSLDNKARRQSLFTREP